MDGFFSLLSCPLPHAHAAQSSAADRPHGSTMARAVSHRAAAASSSDAATGLPRLLRWPIATARGLLFNHAYFPMLLALVLVGEAVLGSLIIQRIAYTEIDWIAYMEEVAGFLSGDWDYANLKGQTGPLVYPAGFVYLYSALYYITNLGTNILLAQYIFLGLYLAFIAVLMLIYHEAKVCPPWVFLFLCVSRRIHSIFMLRCFNDCFALFFLYVAIYAILRHRWTLGCLLVSVALSIKMNILLFLPALGVLLLQRFGFWGALKRLLLMAGLQVVLAVPFLLVAPWNYLRLAFDFGRQFFYVWTVNLKILPEDVFLSQGLARGLLAAHLIVLVIFLNKMLEGGVFKFAADVLRGGFSPSVRAACVAPSSSYIVTLMFVSNFVGIMFAKSLHYQFYVWYYHTLPLLLYLAPLPNVLRLLLLVLIEYSWNVFPATATSSGILIASHLTLLIALLFSTRLPKPPSTTPVQLHAGKKVQ